VILFRRYVIGCVLLVFVLVCLKSSRNIVSLNSSARAQYIGSHSAIENFILPKPGRRGRSLRGFVVSSLRLIVLANFAITISWSSLYLISRFVSAISMGSYGSAVVMGFLVLGALYAALLGSMCVSIMVIEKYFPEIRVQGHAKRMLTSMNNTVTNLIGVDKDGTEGEEDTTVNLADTRHEELLSRLESLERALTDATRLTPPCSEDDSDEFDGYDEVDDINGSFIGPRTSAI
jgi:hypothetical protein